MRNSIFGLMVGIVFLLPATNASALSCLPIDMYLDTTVGDETTQIFIGTASAVKDHTQVVAVTKALQGWVADTVWVEHPYSTDWQYFCSSGPAKLGAATVFLTILDQYGSYSVTQTLSLDSELAKKLIEKIEDADEISAGISEATPAERVETLKQSMHELLKTLIKMLTELKYWQNK